MPEVPFATRLWFAWICFFRVLFDSAFASRTYLVRDALPAPVPADPKPVEPPAKEEVSEDLQSTADETPRSREAQRALARQSYTTPALHLLAIFQREGRLLDFLEEDLDKASDAELGAVARVVHAQCKKALHGHAKVNPIRTEDEGTRITLEAGFNAAEVRLTGRVQGKGPYSGTLAHRGWRVSELSLPVAVKGHDASVVAQAEVEL